MLRKGGFRFDDRKKEILGAIVRTHIATGEPVGSRSLAKQSSEGLSSATIRNICAELEDEGLLSHPHTSAGRLPTDKGYRFYVDSLKGYLKLSSADAARIKENLLDGESLSSPEALMERTSRLLSQLSNNVGIVISPSISQEGLHHIEFVRLGEARILVITVSSAGRAQHRVVRIDADLSQEDLNSTGRYLVENFYGWSLSEIRDEIVRRMTEEKLLYYELLRNAMLLCSQSLQDGDQPDVFLQGASNILAQPDFSDSERLRALFKVFEQKSRIVKILDECIQSTGHQVVGVRIGSENHSIDLHGCTVIASRCFYGGVNAVGGIGVVGPTRLEYDRLISIVDYIARLFEKVLRPEAVNADGMLRADAL
jgi:heat-inducible transcriptional repressor